MRPATTCFAHLKLCLVGSLSLLPPALIKSPRCVCMCVCVCVCVMVVDSQPRGHLCTNSAFACENTSPFPVPSHPTHLSIPDGCAPKETHTHATIAQIPDGFTHTHTHRSQMGSRPRKIHTTPQPPLRDSAVCTCVCVFVCVCVCVSVWLRARMCSCVSSSAPIQTSHLQLPFFNSYFFFLSLSPPRQ